MNFLLHFAFKEKNFDEDLRGYAIWALKTRVLLYLYSLLLLLTLGEILIKKLWSQAAYVLIL